MRWCRDAPARPTRCRCPRDRYPWSRGYRSRGCGYPPGPGQPTCRRRPPPGHRPRAPPRSTRQSGHSPRVDSRHSSPHRPIRTDHRPKRNQTYKRSSRRASWYRGVPAVPKQCPPRPKTAGGQLFGGYTRFLRFEGVNRDALHHAVHRAGGARRIRRVAHAHGVQQRNRLANHDERQR